MFRIRYDEKAERLLSSYDVYPYNETLSEYDPDFLGMYSRTRKMRDSGCISTYLYTDDIWGHRRLSKNSTITLRALSIFHNHNIVRGRRLLKLSTFILGSIYGY